MAKKFKLFIIVDGDNTPMAWDSKSEQLCFCYCDNQRYEDPFPVKIVTRETARKQIQKTIINRKKWKIFDSLRDCYYLMPVKRPSKNLG